MVTRMLAAAGDRVVISEPVRNLASSRLGIVARIAAGGTATTEGAQAGRFDADSLRALMDNFGAAVVHAGPAPGGREHVYVLRAGAP